MKYLIAISLILAVSGGAAFAQTFTLESSDLGGQMTKKQFGNQYGCTGEDISPELHWKDAPKNTAAFAVTMYDEDAPTGSGFWHWLVYDIPPAIRRLKSGAGDYPNMKLPKGAVAARNDAGTLGYFGPCPTPGPAHRYVITVYALKKKLRIPANASDAMIGFMLNSNAIGKASILVYGKKR